MNRKKSNRVVVTALNGTEISKTKQDFPVVPQAIQESIVLNSNILKISQQLIKSNEFLIYDFYKTYDMSKALDFASKYLHISDYILFCGAYRDATLQMFSKLCFEHLYGIDLNFKIAESPNYWKIKYYQSDMKNTHFPDNFFNAIFSLSVIEHLDSQGGNIFKEIEKFLGEASHKLDNGGYLILTTDFGRNRIAKKGANVFDLSDLKKIISLANQQGFKLITNDNFDIIDLPVKWLKEDYTFAFMAFKLEKPKIEKPLKLVNIISPQRKQVDPTGLQCN